mmetsp:Transcript_10604/g.21807  ORF Transcript_10604/g.21807 Transcript_10604/m.21807 type:complete len:88 (-) Transcript_10604:1002-1265(-)
MHNAYDIGLFSKKKISRCWKWFRSIPRNIIGRYGACPPGAMPWKKKNGDSWFCTGRFPFEEWLSCFVAGRCQYLNPRSQLNLRKPNA